MQEIDSLSTVWGIWEKRVLKPPTFSGGFKDKVDGSGVDANGHCHILNFHYVLLAVGDSEGGRPGRLSLRTIQLSHHLRVWTGGLDEGEPALREHKWSPPASLEPNDVPSLPLSFKQTLFFLGRTFTFSFTVFVSQTIESLNWERRKFASSSFYSVLFLCQFCNQFHSANCFLLPWSRCTLCFENSALGQGVEKHLVQSSLRQPDLSKP